MKTHLIYGKCSSKCKIIHTMMKCQNKNCVTCRLATCMMILCLPCLTHMDCIEVVKISLYMSSEYKQFHNEMPLGGM